MLFLYHNPNTVYKILHHSSKQIDTLKQLCDLFSFQMYDNPLKPDIQIDEEFFMVLTRTLKDEIETFKTFSRMDLFLNKDGINWNLLSTLINRSEVNNFFVNSLQSIIKQIDYNENYKGISFDFNQFILITQNLQSLNKFNSSHIEDDSFLNKALGSIESDLRQPLDRAMTDQMTRSIRLNEDNFKLRVTVNNFIMGLGVNDNSNTHLENFFGKYGLSLERKNLIQEINKTNNESKKDYISKQIGILGNDSKRFDVEILLNKIYPLDDSISFLISYSKQFHSIITLIEQLLNTIYNFSKFIPSSIKYVLTIIAKLLKKKHHYIQPFELTGMLMRFYYSKIIEPLITNLDLYGLTTIVSVSTTNVLQIISKVINKFFSGEMFTSKEEEVMYLPFNHYFLDKIETYCNFFNEIINEKLSKQVNSIIESNDNEIENLCYNFFEEHPHLLITKGTIFVTLKQFIHVYNILKSKQHLIIDDHNKSIFKALDQITIQTIINVDNAYNEEQYLCLSDNEQYFNQSNLLIKALEPKKQKKTNACSSMLFTDLKEKQEFVKYESNVVKVMKYLKHILQNSLPDIPERNFFGYDIKTMDDFISTLCEMKNINYENFNFKNDTLLYLNLFIKKIKEIEYEYKENNYALFLSELINDTKELIELYDIDVIIQLKYSIEKLSNLIENKNAFNVIIDQIKLNNEVIRFITQEKIYVKLTLTEEKKGKAELSITETREIKEDHTEKKKRSTKLNVKCYCSNIKDFIKKFQLLYETDTNNKVKTGAFDVLVYYIKNCIYPKIQNKPSVKPIIRDYIMNKLYNCFFPLNPVEEDLRVVENIHNENERLIEMLELKNNFDDLLENVQIMFNNLNNARNPNEKYRLLNKIFTIHNLLAAKTGKDEKGDSIHLFEYFIMYSNPTMLCSNIKYVRMFSEFIDTDSMEVEKVLSEFEMLCY